MNRWKAVSHTLNFYALGCSSSNRPHLSAFYICVLQIELWEWWGQLPGVSDPKVPSRSYLRTQMFKLPPSAYELHFCKNPQSLILRTKPPDWMFDCAIVFWLTWTFDSSFLHAATSSVFLCVCACARVCLCSPTEVMNELQLHGPLVSMDSWWMKWKLLK